MSSNRGHRAGQCAPEVPRTRIRARGDLQELRHRQPAAAFAIQHLRLGQATASSGGDTEVALATGADGSRHLRLSEQRLQVGSNGDGRIYINKCRKVRTPQLRVSKSGPGAPDC